MIIDQLPSISTVEATDELPIEKGTLTYKASVSKLMEDMGIQTEAEVGDVSQLSGFAATTVVGALNELNNSGKMLPAGGTTGQVLAKASNDDYDTEWIDREDAVTETAVDSGITLFKKGKFCIITCDNANFSANGYVGIPVTTGTKEYRSVALRSTGAAVLLFVWGNVLYVTDVSGTPQKVTGVTGQIAFYSTS